MARLFVAVDIDERARSAIAEISRGLAHHLRREPGAGRITWVRPEHLHLTVRFLGEVEQRRIDPLQGAFIEPLTTADFDLSFQGLGMFPAAGRPRVVWLGIRDGRPELERLGREVDERLRAAGVAPEDRSFRAHLTLGRFRNATRRPAIDAADVGTPAIGPCRIDRVTLYESQLSTAGPRYTPLAQALTKERS
jgi:RNA 2',3'-cyclic 3'-phosphodiesterase